MREIDEATSVESRYRMAQNLRDERSQHPPTVKRDARYRQASQVADKIIARRRDEKAAKAKRKAARSARRGNR